MGLMLLLMIRLQMGLILLLIRLQLGLISLLVISIQSSLISVNQNRFRLKFTKTMFSIILILNFSFQCVFAYSLRKFSIQNWSMEQKWMTLLLPLLLLFNGLKNLLIFVFTYFDLFYFCLFINFVTSMKWKQLQNVS